MWQYLQPTLKFFIQSIWEFLPISNPLQYFDFPLIRFHCWEDKKVTYGFSAQKMYH